MLKILILVAIFCVQINCKSICLNEIEDTDVPCSWVQSSGFDNVEDDAIQARDVTEISPYIDEDSTDQEVLARDATETELDSRQSATELPHSRDSEDSTDQDATEAEALQIEQDSQASTYVLVEDTTDQDVDTRDATEAYPYEIIEAREVIHHADENKLDSESATEASEDSESRVASEDESATEASEEVETRDATEVSPYVLIEDNADQDVEISDATEANDQDSREASVTEVYEADSS